MDIAGKLPPDQFFASARRGPKRDLRRGLKSKTVEIARGIEKPIVPVQQV